MKVKYNRVSTIIQSGNRFLEDRSSYDLVLMDKVSGNINFFDRPNGKVIYELMITKKLNTIVVEELSRLGRNHLDVMNTLDIFERHNVNVSIRNLGLSSIVDGKHNPLWKIVVNILSTMYSLELENIKERTHVGRQVFLLNGGKLGRPKNTVESEKKFLEKEKTQQIIKQLKKQKPIRDISRILNCSTTTVVKVKKILNM